ncbi:MAG TPA: MarR family transcriptional regulator [Pseudomonadales bacterium]
MANEVEALIEEARLFYQSIVQIGESLHAGSGISMGMRGVLEYLDREGDATVPAMARARRVSRQRIQTLVNALATRRLVRSVPNPASRRSPLIAITRSGTALIRRMRERERRALQVGIAPRRLREAEATLRRLREALEGGR